VAKKPKRPRAPAGAVVTAYGNTWSGVAPGSDDDVRAVEKALGVAVGAELAAFLMTCGGGRPERAYFEGPDSQVMDLGIGYVLPLRDASRKGGLVTECTAFRDASDMDPDLIPIALDTGHANPICVRVSTGEVVYWLHDDPDDRVRRVAPSLAALLRGLGECPF